MKLQIVDAFSVGISKQLYQNMSPMCENAQHIILKEKDRTGWNCKSVVNLESESVNSDSERCHYLHLLSLTFSRWMRLRNWMADAGDTAAAFPPALCDRGTTLLSAPEESIPDDASALLQYLPLPGIAVANAGAAPMRTTGNDATSQRCVVDRSSRRCQAEEAAAGAAGAAGSNWRSECRTTGPPGSPIAQPN